MPIRYPVKRFGHKRYLPLRWQHFYILSHCSWSAISTIDKAHINFRQYRLQS
jgi:hypothetical protein